MTAIYIIICAVCVVMLAASICACFRSGEKENICKYDYKGDNNK